MIRASTQLRQTKHLGELTQADILDAADMTYASLVADYGASPENVHCIGLCVPATKLMVGYLGAMGHRAMRVSAPRRIYHHYVSLEAEEGTEKVFADATWQQFLDAGLIRPELPKVLIGTRDELVEAARGFGVETVKLNAYMPQAKLMLADSLRDPVQ